MAPSVSVNFISLVTYCVRLQDEEEPQTAYLMSVTWESCRAAIVLTGRYTLPNQSYLAFSFVRDQ